MLYVVLVRRGDVRENIAKDRLGYEIREEKVRQDGMKERKGKRGIRQERETE